MLRYIEKSKNLDAHAAVKRGKRATKTDRLKKKPTRDLCAQPTYPASDGNSHEPSTCEAICFSVALMIVLYEMSRMMAATCKTRQTICLASRLRYHVRAPGYNRQAWFAPLVQELEHPESCVICWRCLRHDPTRRPALVEKHNIASKLPVRCLPVPSPPLGGVSRCLRTLPASIHYACSDFVGNL